MCIGIVAFCDRLIIKIFTIITTLKCCILIAKNGYTLDSVDNVLAKFNEADRVANIRVLWMLLHNQFCNPT